MKFVLRCNPSLLSLAEFNRSSARDNRKNLCAKSVSEWTRSIVYWKSMLRVPAIIV